MFPPSVRLHIMFGSDNDKYVLRSPEIVYLVGVTYRSVPSQYLNPWPYSVLVVELS